jgi:hypothetical protein
LPGGITDAWSIISLIAKTSLRSYIPAYAGKTASAYAEWVIPELQDKVLNLQADDSIPELEKAEMIAETQREIEHAKYFAGQKLVEPKPLEGGGLFERAPNDFMSILMDHWFKLPRPELMVGNESKADELFKKMKSEALKAAGAASTKQIEAQESQLNALIRRVGPLPPGPEREQALERVVAARQILNEMKSRRSSLQQIIGREFDAQMRAVKSQTRSQKQMVKGLKRYQKDGLRVLNRSQRTKGREYVRKKTEREYEQMDKELFPPGP